MQTPEEWLKLVKKNPTKFNAWLSSQYNAELEAAERIALLAEQAEKPKEKLLLTKIANDELIHSLLIKTLCINRGIDTNVKHNSRYYKEVKLDQLSKDQTYALGYHAEKMRLARIEAICNDKMLAEDVVNVFHVILKDEQMHEKAFKHLASEQAIEEMKNKHELGVKALGLKL